MKLPLLLSTCALIFSQAHGSAIPAPIHPLILKDLTDAGEVKEIGYWDDYYYHRPKRTLDANLASAQALVQLKTAAIQGTKNKIIDIAQGSAGAALGAATSALGAASSVHQLKNAALGGIASLAVGSAKSLAGSSSSGFTKTLSGSAQGVNTLKLALAREINNKLSQIAQGSVGLVTGASASIQNNVDKATGDIMVGGVAVADQLKSAIVAGTEKKLGLAASGLAGAVTGAVGSVSAGIGQIARGIFTASHTATNNVKNGIVTETQSKLSQVNQLKSTLLSGLTSSLGGILKGIGSASSGSAQGVFQLKQAALSKLAQGSIHAATGASGKLATGVKTLAGGSVSAVVGASGGAASGVGSLIKSSAGAGFNLKKAALGQLANGVKQVAVGSVQTAAGASGSAIKAAGKGLYQLKSAAFQHLSNGVKQAAQASVQGAVSASQDLHGGIKKAAQGIIGASEQAFEGVHQVKTGALAQLSKLAQGAASASGKGFRAVDQLKETSVEGLMLQISKLADASVDVLDSPASMQRRSLDSIEVETDLPKRSDQGWSTGSDSGDIINQIKTAVVSGLKQKISQVAKGSAGAVAGASAGFSKGSFGGSDSKGHSYEHHGYEPSHTDEHKSVNVWDFKKNVLNTLLQAVKAIKGGVLALKGQLIKGSGFVVSGGGKLIAASGDKVTQLGKNIISNAVLVPAKEHYSHSDYSSHSSGPGDTYGPPSHSYESHYDHHNDKPHHAGILILRKMPTHDKYHSSHSHVEESIYPGFKPPSTGPTFGTVVGKFFSASTSLNPHDSTKFTDEDVHPVYNHAEDSHSDLVPPGPPHYEEPKEPAPISYQSSHLNQHSSDDLLQPPSSDYGAPYNSQQFDDGELPQPPSTNYGVPFDFHQSNDNLGGSASAVMEQSVKLTQEGLNLPDLQPYDEADPQ